MENNTTYYIDLITKYFAGEASEEEILLLCFWLKSDPDFKSFFEDYKKTWNILENNRINKAINIDKEWDKFKLNIHNNPVNNISKIKFLPGNKNILKRNFFIKTLKIAAVFILILFASVVVYRSLSVNEPVKVFAKNDVVENKLPDGTFVVLNSGSTLEYPRKFENFKREINFKGEAYFKVMQDENKPFIIFSDDIRIEVLGTSFYVNTNADNNKVEVILASGKVAVYYKDKPNEKTVLLPGEKAMASLPEQIISKAVNDNINYLAWNTKKIVFVNDMLSEIVKTLNKIYHSDIQIKDRNISNLRITATFDHQSLESVLTVLRATVNININKTSSGIEISSR
jgi:transmembrane sensor